MECINFSFVQNVAASLPPFGMASAFGGVPNHIPVLCSDKFGFWFWTRFFACFAILFGSVHQAAKILYTVEGNEVAVVRGFGALVAGAAEHYQVVAVNRHAGIVARRFLDRAA